jgi:histidine triad (HIT) family protein
MSCIFCQIISGEAPGSVLYRDGLVTVFRDIHPIAATHILIVPNRHIDSVNDLEQSDDTLISHMIMIAKDMAAREGVAEAGYRLIINTGPDGGQTIQHLHLHLIAGKRNRFLLA